METHEVDLIDLTTLKGRLLMFSRKSPMVFWVLRKHFVSKLE